MGLFDLFSIQWWLEYLVESYEREPGHVLLEIACFITIIYLLFRQSYDPTKVNPLSQKEQNDLIAEWHPEPLCPVQTQMQKDFSERKTTIIDSGPGSEGKISVGGKEFLNFASCNFLGLADSAELKKACTDTICKYGVGSCGPRGFYGSIDTHIKLEEDFAKFVGVDEAIYYSDGIACMSSVIAAFAKRGDIIICDEAVNFGIQQGVHLSRSNVLYFKHNDMDDLERVLSDVDEKQKKSNQPITRRFIISEGISEYHGDVCPLDKLIALKNKYKYRVILDDSLAFGVLGKTGRGTTEHFSIDISEITFYVVTTDKCMASVGGLCMGEKSIVDHQRLSGAGYCFSASAPPYSAVAGSTNLRRLATMGNTLADLRDKCSTNNKNFAKIDGVVVSGDSSSPIMHLRLQRSRKSHHEDLLFWFNVQDKMREKGIIVDVPCYIPSETQPPAPSLRVMLSVNHSNHDLDTMYTTLSNIIREALSK